MTYEKAYLNTLLDECDYPSSPAIRDSVIRQLQALEGPAAELFEQWTAKRRLPSDAFSIEGITPAWLRQTHQMADPAIIICYGHLLSEPKRAAALLRLPAIRHKAVAPRK